MKYIFILSNRIQKSSTVNAKNNSKQRFWSNDEVERLQQLKDRGRSDAQIGKALNRTAMAIQCKWTKIKKLRRRVSEGINICH